MEIPSGHGGVNYRSLCDKPLAWKPTPDAGQYNGDCINILVCGLYM